MRLVSALVLSFFLLNGCDRLTQLAQQPKRLFKDKAKNSRL